MSDATATPTPPVGSAAAGGVAAVDSAAPSLLSALLASVQSLTLELSRRDAEQVRRDAEQQARLEVLAHTMLVRALPPPPSISTAASVGSSIHRTLELQCAIEEFSLSSAAAAATEGSGGGDSTAPVMAAAILYRLAACETEAALVVAATPALCSARRLGDGAAGAAAPAAADPCPLVLVNSERRQWLDSRRAAPRQPAHRLKPGLFMTWAPCWRGTARGGAAGNEGVLASRALQCDGCVREVYETKLGEGDLTMEDFGQLADYHALLPGLCRGMLFNARHFWLYESHDGHPLRLVKAALDARGSLARLRCFFDDPARPLPDPPLIRTLRALMRALGVVPCERAPRAGSFLGAGASGRAFAVRYYAAAPAPPGAPAPPPLALKVSCRASSADLSYEFEQAEAAVAAGASVVPVLARSLHIVVGDDGRDAGGGFLLRDVLEPFAVTSAARCAAAFASLQALHAAGIVHGDARLPNLLATGPRADAAWIDMRAAAAAGLALPAAVRRAADAETLAASILQTSVAGLRRPRRRRLCRHRRAARRRRRRRRRHRRRRRRRQRRRRHVRVMLWQPAQARSSLKIIVQLSDLTLAHRNNRRRRRHQRRRRRRRRRRAAACQ